MIRKENEKVSIRHLFSSFLQSWLVFAGCELPGKQVVVSSDRADPDLSLLFLSICFLKLGDSQDFNIKVVFI